MPIKIPDDLPARKTLEEEGVDVISEHDAIRQDIRPIRIALLNLMPEKIKTETQIARLLGASPLQIEITLVTTASYTPTNTPREHMLAFYEPFHQIEDQAFDGLIVTGAPVEEMPFEEVQYWDELAEIFDWAETNVHSTFNICWGAQASLYHRYGRTGSTGGIRAWCAASTTSSSCRSRAIPRCAAGISTSIPSSRC